MYQKCGARTELKPISFFYILYTFSILLQNGEEIGMKKDRLFLLDETVVPASLTQLREVTSAITTQIVILVSFLACFVSTFSRLDAPFLLAIKRLCVRLGLFNVELHYGAILGRTPYVYYTTPYSSYTVYANLLDRFLKKVGKSEEEIELCARERVKYRV